MNLSAQEGEDVTALLFPFLHLWYVVKGEGPASGLKRPVAFPTVAQPLASYVAWPGAILIPSIFLWAT